MITDWGGWTSLLRMNPSINNAFYWYDNVWTELNWYYNYFNKVWSFNINEVYVNKTLWWDWAEYYFEKIWNDLYTKRGTLKGKLMTENWWWLASNLTNWINYPYSNPEDIYWTDHYYVLHNNTLDPLHDFPFYTAVTRPNDILFSDNWWWGRDYVADVTTNIFVRDTFNEKSLEIFDGWYRYESWLFAESCLWYLNSNYYNNEWDWTYWLKNSSGSAFKVTCDMTNWWYTKLSTYFASESDRLDWANFLKDSWYWTSNFDVDLCLECWLFPQYIRDGFLATSQLYCKYKYYTDYWIDLWQYAFNTSYSWVNSHIWRDGLFVGSQASWYIVRSEIESDYTVHEEILCDAVCTDWQYFDTTCKRFPTVSWLWTHVSPYLYSEVPTSCNNIVLSHKYEFARNNTGFDDGIYTINPWSWNINVYCDMTTDGGGWTLVHKTTDNAADLTWDLTTNEWIAWWDDNDEYRLSINYWKDLSTEKVMAINIDTAWQTWNDIEPWVITSISTGGVVFSQPDTYAIFNNWAGWNPQSTCTSWTNYWNWSCCSRCVNYDNTSTYWPPANSPMISMNSVSTALDPLSDLAWWTNDANWFRLVKMWIFIK